jgi:hypothetical protein
MWVFCRLLLLFVGILVVNLQLSLRQGEFAAPVSVTVEGLTDEEIAGARLLTVDIFDAHKIVEATTPGSWECPPRFIVEVVLQFSDPQPPTGSVRITIGSETFTMPLQELESLNGTYWLPEHVNLGAVPWFANCRNWPGREVFLRSYLTRAAPGLIFVLLLGMTAVVAMRLPLRGAFVSITGLAVAPTCASANASASSQRFWGLIGWLGLIGGFIGLECLQPYYFTQDDVLVGELPGALLGCRSLWEGVFPDWNPYVFLGAPLASMGFSSLTYPPLLISYALARHVLGDENATMEVFAALHLLVGFVAQRLLCRRIGMGAFTANLAALSFVFAGCIIIMGRSWHYFIAFAVWLPLLGLAVERFRTGPVGWKWIVGVGLVLGLAYHAGFPQIVAILGMFFCLALAVVAFGERLPLRRLAAVVPALLLGIGLAMPLLLHHLQMTGGHERFVPAETGVYDQLHGALLPYPLGQAHLPIRWGSVDAEKMGHFYFFGGLFAVLFAFQAVCFWAFWPDRRAWASAWWIPCGIFALLMVLGEPAYLWQGIAELPMSKFFLRYTIRFYPLLAFCAILSGGLLLERVLATLRQRLAWELLLGAVTLGVLGYHLAMCQASFYSYGFRPYPDLPREFEETFHPYADKQFVGAENSRRIASWAQRRSVAPDYCLSLPWNMPGYYQVPSIFGYDPIVEGQPRMAEAYRRLEENPAAAYKAYGVGWHLCSYTKSPVLSPNQGTWSMEREVNAKAAYRRLPKADLSVVAESHGTTLLEMQGVDPLAFATPSNRPLPMHLHCRGADVDITGLPAGTSVTINFLWYPQMKCALDGEPLPVREDAWQRITMTLPRAGTTLAMRFEPPWLQTCCAGAALCAVALALAWFLARFGLHLTEPETKSTDEKVAND